MFMILKPKFMYSSPFSQLSEFNSFVIVSLYLQIISQTNGNVLNCNIFVRNPKLKSPLRKDVRYPRTVQVAQKYVL